MLVDSFVHSFIRSFARALVKTCTPSLVGIEYSRDQFGGAMAPGPQLYATFRSSNCLHPRCYSTMEGGLSPPFSYPLPSRPTLPLIPFPQ